MENTKKVSKKEFLNIVSKNGNIPIDDVIKTYDAIVSSICDVVISGRKLTLASFGSFYLQKHKGHPIQFSEGAVRDDYIVFKFSASSVLNEEFRALYRDGKIELKN